MRIKREVEHYGHQTTEPPDLLFIEQVIKRENRPAGFMGLACSVAGLAVFGADSMVIPAMALTLIALLLGRKKLCA